MSEKKLEWVFEGRLDTLPIAPRRVETAGLQQGVDEEVKAGLGQGLS